VFAVLRSMMAHAVDDGRIPANPCSRVPLPRREPRVVEPLAAAEVVRLAEAMRPDWEIAVWLGAGAGLREGEVLGLLTSRVDFLRRRIHVLEQMQNRQMAPLKTRSSRRVVPVDNLVIAKIAEHVERQTTSFDIERGLLITSRAGEPVARNRFGHAWQSAVQAAGLPEGTRFHDLRHFYASSLIAAGLHPKIIQTRLGHATIKETMDTYGHLFPDAEDAGRGAIDAMFARPETVAAQR
jgi:integrase